jgi:hypothetical protein
MLCSTDFSKTLRDQRFKALSTGILFELAISEPTTYAGLSYRGDLSLSKIN